MKKFIARFFKRYPRYEAAAAIAVGLEVAHKTVPATSMVLPIGGDSVTQVGIFLIGVFVWRELGSGRESGTSR